MANWRQKLGQHFQEAEKTKQDKDASEMTGFISDVVVPAFEEILAEMESHGRDVTVRVAGTSAMISVRNEGEEELIYRIQGRTFPTKVLPYAEIRFRERKGLKLIRVESMFRDGSEDYSLTDITTDEIIESFVGEYTRRVESD